MITSEIVEKACSEVGEFTDDQMMHEFDRFFQKQPGICEFVTELTSDSATEIQELSLFLSYMVFKAVEAAEPEGIDKLKEVSPERIESAYRESESWIDRLEEASQGAATGDKIVPEDVEPFLVQYIISELNQPLEDGTLLVDEQKGEVFFVLKTVISSFAREPHGKEIHN
jgi:3-oxoacyl-(acyl-carrier-protein) synthase